MGEKDEVRDRVETMERIKRHLSEGTGSAAQTSRPKYWAELSIEEKLERLREEVKGTQQSQRYGFERLSDVQRQVGRLNGHTHDASGRAVVGIYDEPNCGQSCAELKDSADPSKVYF